jgi:hypothetical protein
MFLAFLRGRTLLNRMLHRSRMLRSRMLHLRNWMLHLRSGMLHLGSRVCFLPGWCRVHLGSRVCFLPGWCRVRLGSRVCFLSGWCRVHLGSRVCFLSGWCRVRLGGRPCLLDRSRMRLHRLDRALWLVWLYLLLGDRPGDLPYGRDCLRLHVLHSKRPSHGHRLRPSVVH